MTQKTSPERLRTGTSLQTARKQPHHRYVTPNVLVILILILPVLNCLNHTGLVNEMYPHCIITLHDTTISVNTPLELFVTPCPSNAPPIAISWSSDNGTTFDTTNSQFFRTVWHIPDTGHQMIIFRVVSKNGSWSDNDTINVNVRLHAPTVRISSATTSGSNRDTFSLNALAFDTNGTCSLFIWQSKLFDGIKRTTTGSLKFRPLVTDTGRYQVYVSSMDNDSIVSKPDSIVLHIAAVFPRIAPIQDTAIRARDTLHICAHAIDPDGSALTYIWQNLSSGTRDSSVDSCAYFFREGRDTTRIAVSVRSFDGLTRTDSFSVSFGLPPTQMRMLTPQKEVFFGLRDSTFARGAVRFAYSATDPDLPGDSLRYTLTWGMQNSPQIQSFSGSSTSFIAENLDTGRYHWTLDVRDAFSKNASIRDSFTCLLRRDICFVGHSLIVGMGGTSTDGGFRKSLLQMLRPKFGNLHRLRCVGPLLTYQMDAFADDSCFARSGLTSWALLDTVSNHPEVNADIWVLLIGVNGDCYNYWERYYTLRLIDTLHARNPNSCTYVINGLPLPDTITDARLDRLNSFNRMLDSVVTLRRSSGWKIRLIDTHPGLAPNSVFDTSLFVDPVHPNQTGYEVMARDIFNVMDLDW